LSDPTGLAFKAYEIEELADVYFFRPVGMVFARAARALGLTPTAVTLVGAGVGITAGLLFYEPQYGILAFVLLIAHSLIDSSDGQLARMTGQSSELGRVLDGASGYVTHIAIYVAILFGGLARGAQPGFVVYVLAAALANIVHAQMYDYYRSSYAAVVIAGALDVRMRPARPALLRFYEGLQALMAGSHRLVEQSIAARANGATPRDDDRARYRRIFYWPVRGWNLLGDNTRFYALGALAWVHRIEWFPLFVLVPMNAAFVVLWVWQTRANRRFVREPAGSAVL